MGRRRHDPGGPGQALTTKSAQYRYLAARAADLVGRLGLDRFPARSTYFARYRAAYLVMSAAAAAHTAHAAGRGHIDVRCVAADKTLIAAAGPAWPKARRARGDRPAGADAEASWSRSGHDGWVCRCTGGGTRRSSRSSGGSRSCSGCKGTSGTPGWATTGRS